MALTVSLSASALSLLEGPDEPFKYAETFLLAYVLVMTSLIATATALDRTLRRTAPRSPGPCHPLPGPHMFRG